MTAERLITDLRERGVVLVADGHWLRCRPRSALTEYDIAALSEIKPAVLAHLRDEEMTARPSDVCIACKTPRFWRSIHGPIVCAVCHPPPAEELVKERIEIESRKDRGSRGDQLGLDKLTKSQIRERVLRLRRLTAAIRESPEKLETSDFHELLEVPTRSGGSHWYLR